jgi:PAS domain-containing protein
MALTQILRISFLCFLLLGVTGLAISQDKNKQSEAEEYRCHQEKVERDQLIDEADRKEFNTRYVEIVGSTYARDREFRKRMAPGLNEGDIFTRRALEESVKGIAKMRAIYRITMDNVEIRLDRKNRRLNILFCVKQKPKRKSL